jgi:hypothetical protein
MSDFVVSGDPVTVYSSATEDANRGAGAGPEVDEIPEATGEALVRARIFKPSADAGLGIMLKGGFGRAREDHLSIKQFWIFVSMRKHFL